ncbi:hypothetical protein AB4K20DRAFT_1886514 [Rhizopus microsporus]
MYSPRRNPVIRTPERNTISPSPLRALTPFVDAIKSAQTKATKDFESFYGSLMSKLTPKTSTSRIIKKTPETTERTKSFLKQKKIEQEYNRTSLTPLFERHTLREVTDYPSLNPFYEETESEITDDQTELDNNSIMSIDKPFDKREDNKYPSLLDLLKEETTRIDRLQSNISVIKRQSSYLAEEYSFFDDKEDEQIPSHKNNNVKSDNENNNTYTTPQTTFRNTYLTPPQSTDNNNNKKSVNYYSPDTKKLDTSRSVNKTNTTPNTNDLLHEISTAKLKSAEIIRTPGGTRVCNRFWKEIHGINAKRESSLSPRSPSRIEKHSKPKRMSTLQRKLWDEDDDVFWTSSGGSSTNSSSLNERLLKATQMGEQQKERQVKQISLSEEIESATRREQVEQQKKSIPTMNPQVLEELKAKYREKLIDDSDSYKFS